MNWKSYTNADNKGKKVFQGRVGDLGLIVRESNELTVGFVVTTKIGNAVTRNKLRRQLRSLLQNEGLRPDRCYVWQVKTVMDYKSLEANVQALLARASKTKAS